MVKRVNKMPYSKNKLCYIFIIIYSIYYHVNVFIAKMYFMYGTI